MTRSLKLDDVVASSLSGCATVEKLSALPSLSSTVGSNTPGGRSGYCNGSRKFPLVQLLALHLLALTA